MVDLAELIWKIATVSRTLPDREDNREEQLCGDEHGDESEARGGPLLPHDTGTRPGGPHLDRTAMGTTGPSTED